jgi:hypothetical protein
MFKASHSFLAFFSGLIWMAVGVWLLQLGLNLLMTSLSPAHVIEANHYPLIKSISSFTGGWEQTVVMLIALGLLIGHFKGRYVLGKSAKKGIQRITSFPNPTSFSNIYSAKYYILLAVMIGLGISIKFFGVPKDIRGFIDVAIGAALINGAVIYFRCAYGLRKVSHL